MEHSERRDITIILAITNVSIGFYWHKIIEILGSRDAIADAKGELIEALTTPATAVLNADDPYYSRLAAKAPGGILSYGTSGNADVRVLDYRQSDSGRWAKLEIDGDGYGIQVNSPATHDIRNAAAAIAAAVAVGVSPRDAVVDVERYVPSNMRMEVLSSRSGGKILSDCYNAAPSSVKSALLTLSEIRSRGVKSAFLGDMRELGSFTFDMHKDVAAEASRLGIDHVYPIGDAMRQAFPDAPASFANSEEAAHYISAGFVLGPDDFVLVKGSRALQLETVVKALVYL